MINHVISFSGGKDSTAMALEMIERGEDIHSIVCFDTGWEFPAMYDHWKQFEEYTGIELVILHPKQPFTYWLFERPIFRKGTYDKPYRFGNGWPAYTRRWCTREKALAIHRYSANITRPISCIGFASDEAHRKEKISGRGPRQRYPLIEYGIDEKRALEICKSHGFHWDGLYNHFDRVSCYCCPLQSKRELRKLRDHFPDLWTQMLSWETKCHDKHPNFKDGMSVADLEVQFAQEDEQRAKMKELREKHKDAIEITKRKSNARTKKTRYNF